MPALATDNPAIKTSGPEIERPLKAEPQGLRDCLAAFLPLVRAAQDKVQQGAAALAEAFAEAPFDASSIVAMLDEQLSERLLSMAAPALVLELNIARLLEQLSGETPEERFASFVRQISEPERATQFLQEYPVLDEQISQLLDKWAATSLEFLEHLCQDWEGLRGRLLAGKPGALIQVKAGAGDTHRDGRSVMIATFGSGVKLVYKPRSLGVDAHFQQLLEWLNKCGAGPMFRPFQLLASGTHGWTEFIDAAPCSTEAELSRFYQRQGGYLAVLYALEASDFHCENLIAAGEHPVMIDLEALFHAPSAGYAADRMNGPATSALYDSALRVGLLPLRSWADADHPGLDISGLGSVAGQPSPRATLRCVGVGTDETRLVREHVTLSGAANCPTLAGQTARATEHYRAIEEGFQSVYRLIMTHRGDFAKWLEVFAEDEIRVIPRASQTYGTLLQESFHPDLLTDADTRTAHFDRLREANVDRPDLARLAAAECADLLGGDIPWFSTRPNSRDLWTSRGERLENYFEEPSLLRVRKRVLGLGEKDLERQLWIVRAALAAFASDSEIKPATRTAAWLGTRREPAAAELLTEACAIGDRLIELAIRDKDEAGWLGLLTAGRSGRVVAPLGCDLYAGLPGVILFLAQLEAASGIKRYGELAGAALRSLRHQLEPAQACTTIGAFEGWGGVIYLFSHLAALWNDVALASEARTLLNRIPPLIEQDAHFDLISGAAGCILALQSLNGAAEEIRAITQACGKHLLRGATRTPSGWGWIPAEIPDSPPLTGFAHGSAGIALALLQAERTTGDARFATAAREAFAYERALFSVEDGNWPDLRPSTADRNMVAWCHGAPGIGLSRLRAQPWVEDAALDGEIRSAFDITARSGFRGAHTVCHGDLGNADLLLDAATSQRETSWRKAAYEAIGQALDEARETGWRSDHPLGVESAGFMTGLAGIGYTLLRFANPAGVPSVLALDPPRRP